MPVFALANTGIVIGADWAASLATANSLGISLGLVFGKVAGVTLLSVIAVKSGLCKLPGRMTFQHLIGAGLLAGIGFTMSIFITNLAYSSEAALLNSSVMAIFAGSIISGVAGYCWLVFGCRRDRESQPDS